jgi:hypothetical protein
MNNQEQNARNNGKRTDKTNSPVIFQDSAGDGAYTGAPFIRHMILSCG